MASVDAQHSAPPGGENLQRHLSNRHIQLIAIGGAIGTGLFMGSGKTIHAAGPSILLVYVIVGVMLYFVMRAMGELLLHNLEYKSFSDFAGEMIGPWAAFVTGWTYWLCWVVTGMAEIIAVSGYWDFWVHDKTLSILLSLGMLALLLVLNMLTVKLFGEMEFWFAIIKVVAIVALILMGLYMLVTGFHSPDGTKASLSYLWNHGGFFPKGFDGFMAGFQIAIFAFVGIELVGTTAAETADPETTLPRAINAIPVRVLVFYVLALMVIMSVTPWDHINPEVSPFVNIFKLAGLGAAASVMNFVVLTSASSSCNSGLFSTSRMLYGLADMNMAPPVFKRLSRAKVPQNGLFISVLLVATSVFLMLSDTIMGAFTVVTTISAVLFMVVWSLILWSYINYRRRNPRAHGASVYKMPGAAFMPYVVLAFFCFIVYVLTQASDTLQAMIWTPLWFVFLAGAWFITRKKIAEGTASADGVRHLDR